MAALKKQSLVDQLYDQLRANIVNLSIPLGSRLNVNELQEKFGVSSTPIREAMNRLQVEGLVTYESNIGGRVVALREQDVLEIHDLALTLHTAAIRFAMERADRKTMAEDICRFITGYENAKTADGRVKNIHNLIGVFYKYCGNSRLDANMKIIQGQQLILRYIYQREVGAKHSTARDYERICEAVLAGDTQRVIDILAENYHRAAPIILSAIGKYNS